MYQVRVCRPRRIRPRIYLWRPACHWVERARARVAVCSTFSTLDRVSLFSSCTSELSSTLRRAHRPGCHSFHTAARPRLDFLATLSFATLQAPRHSDEGWDRTQMASAYYSTEYGTSPYLLAYDAFARNISTTQRHCDFSDSTVYCLRSRSRLSPAWGRNGKGSGVVGFEYYHWRLHRLPLVTPAWQATEDQIIPQVHLPIRAFIVPHYGQ